MPNGEAPATPQVDLRDVCEWLLSRDTGTSSKTMVAVILGLPCAWPSAPSDGDDFGRCYRLLKKIPGLRDELHKMRGESKTWARLVDHWEELERLYEDGSTPAAHQLYERMKQLGC